jgi:poly(A) polymerase
MLPFASSASSSLDFWGSPMNSESPQQQKNCDASRAFAVDVVQSLKNAGFIALWAGGCVRDSLLGRTPKDYDVATDATPEQVRDVFGKRRTLGIGESFGVIVVLGPKDAEQIEVATFRTDGLYLDGRRPSSVQFSSPEEDAQRRDFTINGMFFDPIDEKLLDYVGGEKDLAAGMLRAIGNPSARMEEDKLRMLRAVRFASTFGFELDSSTANSIREMAEQIRVVSAERISQELRKMLAHANRALAITLCKELGLFTQILPELQSLESGDWACVEQALSELKSSSFPTAFAMLFICTEFDSENVSQSGQDIAKSVVSSGKQLKLSNEEIEQAEWISKNLHRLDNAQALPLATLKRTLVHKHASDLLEVMRVVRIVQSLDAADVEFCREFLQSTPDEILNPSSIITGKELIDLGLKPGPRFKEILWEIRDAQLNLEVVAPTEALEMAQRLAGL